MKRGMNASLASASTPTAASPALLRSVHLAGPSGRLEAILNEGSPDSHFAALLCHPHPRGGGNLHNKVVYHAMKAINEPAWGFAAPILRFNFRGTGLSAGAHDGQLEAEDVLAAMTWLKNEFNRPLVVAGFSFGAAMALKACCSSAGTAFNVRALVALGLPTEAEGRQYSYKFLSCCPIPKLLLSGDHDQFAPAAQLAQIAQSAAPPTRLLFISGGDHFFHNQLEPMQQALAGWLKEQLQ